jgi:hypothetical protein
MSGRRASRRKRIRGELIGAHCATCGEPLMFVARDPAWDLTSDVVCPSCADPQTVGRRELSPVDRAAVALRVLLLAGCLKDAVESEEVDHQCLLAQSCRTVADELAHLSAQIVPNC